MVPQLRSAADAAAAVRCVRYPPQGARGVALSVRGAGYGEASASEVTELGEAVTTLVQIENADALADVEAIAARRRRRRALRRTQRPHAQPRHPGALR